MLSPTPMNRRGRWLSIGLRCVFGACACAFWPSGYAQIYTCTAEDGTRIFSDERCGPDAKIVPGITSKKRGAASSAAAKRAPRSPAELEELLARCNDGEIKACNEWTHGGGPNQLREQEQRAGAACEGGSVVDCELRYCTEGMTKECRARVSQAATISGEHWYLRAQHVQQDGGTQYEFRCAIEGEKTIRESSVICTGPPGPKRCVLSATQQGFARFDQAAANHCVR